MYCIYAQTRDSIARYTRKLYVVSDAQIMELSHCRELQSRHIFERSGSVAGTRRYEIHDARTEQMRRTR